LGVLVLWDLTRRPWHRWAGVGIGLAAAIKLTPALFAVFLLVTGVVAYTRRGSAGPWLRHARGAAVAFAGATLLAASALPYDSWRFWSRMLFETGRVGLVEDTANQSLRGVLARLLHTTQPGLWWVAAAAVAGSLGLGVAVAAELRGRRAWAVSACAVTALLISPVSWSHHWVWCVPMVLILGTRGRAATVGSAQVTAVITAQATAVSTALVTAAGTSLVFCSYALWWVPHGPGRLELQQTGTQLTLSALYEGAGLVFLTLIGVRLWRTCRTA
ncbi:glycosyltransferase 87 family protein, partial [Embleya sp. NPDC056575]|uniref:glycosyltransferase 87 family protein n=1 Tax=Embleya sp. NPDC056575 TaxID=3345869 RepID=UPI00369D4A42